MEVVVGENGSRSCRHSEVCVTESNDPDLKVKEHVDFSLFVLWPFLENVAGLEVLLRWEGGHKGGEKSGSIAMDQTLPPNTT